MPLSTLWSVTLTSAKAIVDTGATQTAGGSKAVWALVDFMSGRKKHFDWRIDYQDRPWFHFGDGGWLQALYKVHLQTALGDIGIFVLDADRVPILIGSDLLESWGILISYMRNTAVFETLEGNPQVAPERSAGGHRLLDLSAEPVRSAMDQ